MILLGLCFLISMYTPRLLFIKAGVGNKVEVNKQSLIAKLFDLLI